MIVRATNSERPGGGDDDGENPNGGDIDGSETDVPVDGGDTDGDEPSGGSGETVDPAHPGTPGVNELATTGGAAPLGIAGIALMLLLAGASVFFWRHRTA